MYSTLSHSPSFILPFNPKIFDTAGRTKNIVPLPVIPKTVQINAISAYHRGVLRGGMGLGPKNRARKVDDCDGCDDVCWLGGDPFLPLLLEDLCQHILDPRCRLLVVRLE